MTTARRSGHDGENMDDNTDGENVPENTQEESWMDVIMMIAIFLLGWAAAFLTRKRNMHGPDPLRTRAAGKPVEERTIYSANCQTKSQEV